MEDKSEKKTLRAVETLIDEDRVLNFSDGVFAFAATLLILKIDLPALTGAEATSPRLAQELISLWPQYFANIISFLMIGYYWLTHHAIFSLVKKYNQQVIWLNILFLIFLSFLPFPVDLFGDYSNSNTIVVFYSLTLSLAGALLAAIWFYALGSNLTDPSLGKRQALYYSLRFLIAPAVFALSIPLVFIDPLVSKISWVFVLIASLLVNRLFNFKRISAIEKESI
jgi:uncharacterized membrane protein